MDGATMKTSARVMNLLGVVLPFAALAVGIVLLWNRAVDLSDLMIFVGCYLVSGFGITVGFHRLLTHRSFKTYKPIEYLFAILGSMAIEGSVQDWVADHRKHHAHSDEEGDPHSPHVGHGSGFKGLVHAHVGWTVRSHGLAGHARYARELIEDRGMRIIGALFPLWAVLSLLIPAGLGWLADHSFTGALVGLLWGGLVRCFFLHHVTWSINSVCHFFGRRRFDVDDRSTNVAWLSLLSMGESWHHNHHAFPRSAAHGLRRTELDPSAWVIRGMRRLRLAWDVVEIAPERQRAKLAAGAV